jgi:hypothetical protein
MSITYTTHTIETDKLADKLFKQKDKLYAVALRFWSTSICINFGTFSIILVSIFIENGIATWIFGLITLISPIAFVASRIFFETKFRQADRCNRLLHYADSLGINIPSDEVACLLGESLKNIPSLMYSKPYYVSNEEKGPERLVSNTRESSFFTFKLASYTKSYCLIAISFMVLIVVILCYTIFNLSSSPQEIKNIQIYAKFISGIVSFFFTGDIILLYLKWDQMGKEAEITYHTLDRILGQGNISIEEAMMAVEEYHISIIQGVPIPVWIYLHYRDTLNSAYQSAHGITT